MAVARRTGIAQSAPREHGAGTVMALTNELRLSRRHLLLGSAALAGGLSMPSIVGRAAAQDALAKPDFCKLKNFGALNTPFIGGLRPHRRRGARLEEDKDSARRLGPNRFLFHNYGHSGAGITMSWGCAREIVTRVEPRYEALRKDSARPAIAVLGCGIMGLTVAAELEKKWPGTPITIYAKETDVAKTTSYVAGGQFEPSGIFDQYKAQKNVAELHRYLRGTHAWIKETLESNRGEQYGVAPRDNYVIKLDNGNTEEFDDGIPDNIVARTDLPKLPFPNMTRRGFVYKTWLINPTILLPKLKQDLLERKPKAVSFQQRTFATPDEIAKLPEPIVINCTGLGSKTLFADKDMKGVRGLLIILEKTDPRVNYFFSGGHAGRIAYLFARQHDIVVGGSWTEIDPIEEDRENYCRPDPVACNRILDRLHSLYERMPLRCNR